MLLKSKEILGTFVVASVTFISLLVAHNFQNHPTASQTLTTYTGAWPKNIEDTPSPPAVQKALVMVTTKDPILKLQDTLMLSHLASTYQVDAGHLKTIWLSVKRHTRDTDIEPTLMMAVIAKESSFNQKAISHKGAQGLTQVMPLHSMRLKPGENFQQVDVSVRVGVEILEEYMAQEHGNVRRALQRYNGSIKDQKQRYAETILAQQQSLEQQPMLASNN